MSSRDAEARAEPDQRPDPGPDEGPGHQPGQGPDAGPRPDPQAAAELLARIGHGSESASALMPLFYAELRAIAGGMMRAERESHTLQPTALVHEAFVRLIQGDASLGKEPGEFLAVAARAMRNLLVDHARGRRTQKRGGAWDRVTLGGVAADEAQRAETDVDLLDLSNALEELEQLDDRQARIVEMSFFAGMTGDEIATQLGVHRNTVVRELRMARAWLRARVASYSKRLAPFQRIGCGRGLVRNTERMTLTSSIVNAFRPPSMKPPPGRRELMVASTTIS